MVTRWRVCAAAVLLLSIACLASGQCPAPKLQPFSEVNIGPDVSGSMYSSGAIIKVKCVAGFKTVGFTTFNCQSNNMWSPATFPKCSILFCPKPTGTMFGYFTGNYAFNNTVTYMCDRGYTLVGDVERHCRANQTWSGTAPTCRKTVCPSSKWTAHAGNCYLVSDDSVTYAVARNRCRTTPGADLVSILNNVEAALLTSILTNANYSMEKQLWIGLSDMDQDGGYDWLETGALMDYANWDCGQPGSGSSANPCGTIYAGSSKVGRWGDSSCSGAIGGYVCKQGKAPYVRLVRGDCPSGWYALENKCYKFEMNAPPLSWDDAERKCKSQYNGTLMSASDPMQMALMITYINKYYPATSKQVWLGLKQRQNEHSPWTWSDLACNKYTNWGCGEPNNGNYRGEDCMAVGFGKTQRNAGRWNDDYCGGQKQYACERPYSFTALSSVSSPTCDDTGITCPAGWVQNGRSCYYIETSDSVNWPKAVDRCGLKNGAGLVSISDPTEQAFLTTAIKKLKLPKEKNLWIGMNKDTYGSSYWSFSWPDGTVALYRNWDCEFMAGSSSWNRNCAYMFAGNRTKPREGYWGASSCYTWSSSYEQDGYICEATIPKSSIPQYSQGICQPGWVQGGRTCYYPATKSSDSTTWSNARAACQALGADLAVVKTKEENDFILDYISSNEPTFDQPLWIGLYVRTPMGTANNQTFYWADNATLNAGDYMHWGCGEPNNAGGKEHCGVVGIGAGNEMSSFWNDDQCTKKFNYLCDKPAPKTSPCKAGWLWSAQSSSCYYVETNRTMNFTGAMADCASRGAMMVTILDAAEQNFLTAELTNMRLAPSVNLWIGLNDSDANRVYAWNDGTRPFYNNFECGQPGNGGVRACATMYGGGKGVGQWIDFDCGTAHGYVCKTPGPGLKQLYPITQGSCPTGWVQYRNECYWFEFTQQQPFDTAQASCKTLNKAAQLAIITDDGTLDYFLHYMYQRYPTSVKNMFVGLKKPNSFGAFEWQDNSCNPYTRWGCNEPNNYANNENCGVFGVGADNHNSAKINDDSCTRKQHFVCQMPLNATFAAPPTCKVTPCEPGWVAYRGVCYYISVGKGSIDWNGASNWCLQNRAEIAGVTDSDVNDFLSSQLRAYRLSSSTEVWMGWRSDRNTWPDGTPTLYRNWDCAWASANRWGRNCGYLSAGGGANLLGKWGASYCSSFYKKDGFVCQRRMPGAMAVDSYPQFGQGTCGAGWVDMGDVCYQYKLATTDKTTHANALSRCIAQGGVLGSPSTRSQGNLFMKYMLSKSNGYSGSMWMGLYQKSPTDPFRWEDGSRLVYTNWGCGEPNNAGGAEDCALFSMGTSAFLSSMWNDDRCSNNFNYFCQKPKPSLHPCPAGFFRNHDSCYLFNLNATVDQATATSACVAKGAKLVTIRDRVEQYWLEAILANLGAGSTGTPQRYWIGLGDANSDNVYTWPDSSYALYMNWKCGSPGSGGSQACVAFENSLASTSGTWDDASCTAKLNGYICETYIGAAETYLSYAQGKCGAGWVEFDGMCYQMKLETSDKSTFSEATNMCSGQGAQVLSIHDDSTHQFITHYMTQVKNSFDGAVWIGLSKLQGNRYSAFHWKDGTCLDYNQWGCGEPNDAGSGENCGVVGIGQRNPQSGSWNDDGCTKAYNYICEKKWVNQSAVAATPPPMPVTPAPTCSYSVQCPAGWTKVGASCLWATTSSNSAWTTAAQDCQLRGGSLVSVADASQQSLLRTFLSTLNVTGSQKLWIGLNDFDYSGDYLWPDGSAGIYRYWNCANRGSGRCIYVNATSGRWGRTYCSSRSQNGYICQWSQATTQYTPQTFEQGICPVGWYQRKHLCYKFETTKKATHSAASSACLALNGTLVAVDSSGVQSYLNHYFIQKEPSYDSGVWVGLHQATRHSPWMWADASNISTYSNWGCGEPNDAGSGEDCAIIGFGERNDNSGLWNDDSCTKSANYICQQPVPQLTPCFYGWEYNALSDACVLMNSMDNLTHLEAENWCKAAWPGADLVSIEDAQEQQFIEWQLKTNKLPTGSKLWIGLTDFNNDNYYQWPNGHRNQYSNFDCKLSWWSGREQCVYIDENGLWTPMKCASKASGFMCKYSVPKKDELDTYKLVQGKCAAGYYEFRGLCWFFEDVKSLDYPTAQADCVTKGGNLATIRNAIDSSFISHYRGVKFPLVPHTFIHFGYTKRANLFDQFHWEDNSCPGYSSWGCNEPNNAGSSGESCGQYQFGGKTGSVGFTGQWNDNSCGSKSGYVCQVPIPKTNVTSATCAALTCQTGWVAWRGNCYKFVPNDSQNWPGAYSQCLKMNSALVSISDFTEETWITTQLKKFNFPSEKTMWIGLNDGKYQMYRWSDNTPALYRNWDCDAYSGWNKQCVYIFAGYRKVGTQRTGKWGPESCSSWGTYYNKDGYICESSLPLSNGNVPLYGQGHCDPGWTLFQGRCYYFAYDQANFTNANKMCMAMSSRLGIINTQAKNNFVVDYMIGSSNFTDNNFWIGLHEPKKDGKYQWVNQSEPLVYTNYHCGEPNDGTDEDCIEFHISEDSANSASWNDVRCGNKNNYICDKPAGPAPTTTPPTTVPTTPPPPTTPVRTTAPPTTTPPPTTPPPTTQRPPSTAPPTTARPTPALTTRAAGPTTASQVVHHTTMPTSTQLPMTEAPGSFGDPTGWNETVFDLWLKEHNFYQYKDKLAGLTAGTVSQLGLGQLSLRLGKPVAERLLADLRAEIPTTPAPTDGDSDSSSGLSTGATAAIVVVAVALALAGLLLVVFMRSRRRDAGSGVSYSKQDESILVKNAGDMSATNPGYEHADFAMAPSLDRGGSVQ